MTDKEIWLAAFLAVLRSGGDKFQAEGHADWTVEQYRKRFGGESKGNG